MPHHHGCDTAARQPQHVCRIASHLHLWRCKRGCMHGHWRGHAAAAGHTLELHSTAMCAHAALQETHSVSQRETAKAIMMLRFTMGSSHRWWEFIGTCAVRFGVSCVQCFTALRCMSIQMSHCMARACMHVDPHGIRAQDACMHLGWKKVEQG